MATIATLASAQSTEDLECLERLLQWRRLTLHCGQRAQRGFDVYRLPWKSGLEYSSDLDAGQRLSGSASRMECLLQWGQLAVHRLQGGHGAHVPSVYGQGDMGYAQTGASWENKPSLEFSEGASDANVPSVSGKGGLGHGSRMDGILERRKYRRPVNAHRNRDRPYLQQLLNLRPSRS